MTLRFPAEPVPEDNRSTAPTQPATVPAANTQPRPTLDEPCTNGMPAIPEHTTSATLLENTNTEHTTPDSDISEMNCHSAPRIDHDNQPRPAQEELIPTDASHDDNLVQFSETNRYREPSPETNQTTPQQTESDTNTYQTDLGTLTRYMQNHNPHPTNLTKTDPTTDSPLPNHYTTHKSDYQNHHHLLLQPHVHPKNFTNSLPPPTTTHRRHTS